MRNAVPITVFSVLTSLVFIFLFTFLFSNLPSVLGLRPFSFWNTFAFAASMASSDSAFMIPFLKSYGCSPRILATLDGETILSEVVSILMFRTVVELQITVVDGVQVLQGVSYFLSFLVTSFLIGIGVGLLTTLLFRWLYREEAEVGILEVALFLSAPLMAFMWAEGLHVSSSIAIRMCGLIMSCYAQHNLSIATYPSFLSHSSFTHACVRTEDAALRQLPLRAVLVPGAGHDHLQPPSLRHRQALAPALRPRHLPRAVRLCHRRHGHRRPLARGRQTPSDQPQSRRRRKPLSRRWRYSSSCIAGRCPLRWRRVRRASWWTTAR